MPRNPGLAIGIVSAGGAAGQGLVPYFARYLIVTEGWRQAYWILGLLFIAVMVPLALLLRDAPVAANARPAAGGGPSAVRLLALLSLAALLCCVCMGTPLVHVVTLGSDRGLGGRDAAGLLAVMMVAGMAGRVGFGRLSDRFGSLQTYIAASAGQTALAFLFPYAASGAQLYVLSALFGLVFSGAMTSFLSCAREYAPAGKTGLSLGVVMFFGWTGMALGAWQGGLFYDICGDYFASFANASAAGVANLLVLALLLLYVLRAPGTGKAIQHPFSREIAASCKKKGPDPFHRSRAPSSTTSRRCCWKSARRAPAARRCAARSAGGVANSAPIGCRRCRSLELRRQLGRSAGRPGGRARRSSAAA